MIEYTEGTLMYMHEYGSYTMAQLNAFTGEPITATKSSHPYSYEPFEVYSNNSVETDGGAYDDRMRQWDWDKFAQSCQDVWGNTGQLFNSRTPSKIEEFLRLYNDNPKLILTRIVEGCNSSNGYSYWYFSWNNGE